MIISLKIPAVGTLDVHRPGNVQGDEIVARAFAKYMSRDNRVHQVHLGPHVFNGPNKQSGQKYVIHFNPFLGTEKGCKNILYFQNAYPPEHYDGGSAGIFNTHKDKYDGYMFTSRDMAQACKCPNSAVVPFATDPDEFYQRDVDNSLSHDIAFVGNNIRGDAINEQYIAPALPWLTIYGNTAGWKEKYLKRCKGKIPQAKLPVLYSSAKICINAHLSEHIRYDTVNFRIYNILACGGFVLSDSTRTLEGEFKDCLVTTSGGEDMVGKIQHYLNDEKSRKEMANRGKDLVLSRHTFPKRVQTILHYLQCL